MQTEENKEIQDIFLFLIGHKKLSFRESNDFLKKIKEKHLQFDSSGLERIMKRKKDSWSDVQNAVYYHESFVCDRNTLKIFENILKGV